MRVGVGTMRGGALALLRELPRGRTLPDPLWARRHAGILVILALHVPAIFGYALVRGVGVRHALLETATVAVFAWGAYALRGERRWSTVAAALGLLVCSAVLVHLSGGLIEMHFHFFVVVGIVTLYQDWEPFLIAIAFVVLEHGVGGAFIPGAVYDHADAVRDPWTWAAVHGAFILAMSGAGVASWRLNERLIAQVSRRQEALGDAQRVARLGSWDLDVPTGTITWSEQLFELTGLQSTTALTPEMVLEQVHADDRVEFLAAYDEALRGLPNNGVDCRWHRADGEVRWMHIRSRVSETDAEGAPLTISGTVQDITERIDVDASLRSTLSLLNATLDSTADGILVVGLDGSVTTVNGRFVDMWRLPPDLGAVGVPVGDIVAVAMSGVKDIDNVLERTYALDATPDAESHDIIEFEDGRVFERYSTPQRVGGEVVGRVWTCRDVTEHQRLQDELAHQAFHDPLTGLANQALFRALVEHAVARFGRSHSPLAALFIDLDDFKTVNDSLGHTVGDELLVAVSERLASCVRPADTAARLGGDEFAVLIEEASSTDDATAVAQRIIDGLRQPFAVSGKELYASASIGIAYGQHGVGGDQLLRNADLAMYTAKRRGRHRYEVYEPDMHAAAVERLELEADLRGAIGRDELAVHYQPIVDLVGGRVVGVEALARWKHPTRGLIPPDTFIPLAEDTELITTIGAFVLTEACEQMQTWHERPGCQGLLLTVNLSPRQLLDAHMVDRVASIIETSRLDPATLVLEITEGAMVQDTELAIERLQALKALGVRLAVDDFGTGYSSLSYLHRFPIDIVKIDRSFIEQLDGNPGAPLATAIVRMAQALNLTTIAEGVESLEQLERLQTLGCDLAQGFHLARPDTAEVIGPLLPRITPDAVLA